MAASSVCNALIVRAGTFLDLVVMTLVIGGTVYNGVVFPRVSVEFEINYEGSLVSAIDERSDIQNLSTIRCQLIQISQIVSKHLSTFCCC